MACHKGLAECVICYGSSACQRWSALDCGHTFHQSCLDAWLVRKRDCPSCRVPLGKRKQPLELFLSSVADTADASVTDLVEEHDAQVQELHNSKQQLQQSLEEALATAASAYAAAGTLQDKVDQQEAKLKEEKQKREALRCMLGDERTRSTAAIKAAADREEQYKMHLHQKVAELRQERQKHQRVQQELKNLRVLSNRNMELADIEKCLGGDGKLVPAAMLAARNAELQAAHQRSRELEAQLTAAQAEAVRQRCGAADRARREVEVLEKQRDEAKRAQLHAEVTIDKLRHENNDLQQQLKAALQEQEELQTVMRAVAGPQTVAAARTSLAAAKATTAVRVGSSTGHASGPASSSGTHAECWSQGAMKWHPGQPPVWLERLLHESCSQVHTSQFGSSDQRAAPMSAQQTMDDSMDDGTVPETQLQEATSPPQQQCLNGAGPSATSPIAAPASFLSKVPAGRCLPGVTGSFIRTGPDGMGGTCRHPSIPAAAMGSHPWRSDQDLGTTRGQQQPSRQWPTCAAAKKLSKPLAVTKTLTKPKAQPITRFFGTGAR